MGRSRPQPAVSAVLVALVTFAALAALALVMAGCGGGDGGTPPSPPPSSASSPATASGSPSASPTAAGSPSTSASHYKVSAWTYGDQTALDHALSAGAIDEICVDWYVSTPAGGIVTKHPERLDFVRGAQKRDVRVLATFTNWDLQKATFDTGVATAILATAQTRSAHIDQIVDLCVSKHYDGVDMDWEIVRVRDRDRYSEFIEELAARLKARGKLLSIAVHPKTSDEGTWWAPRAMDYQRLGAAANEFKIMTYEFSGSWGPPGPIAPPSWADAVLDYAETRVAPAKIWMGVPFYGKDWKGKTTSEVRWEQARALVEKHVAAVMHPDDGEAVFEYSDDAGAKHTVVFQDTVALAKKLDMLRAEHPDIAGIAIWRMGQEDPDFWETIAAAFR